MVLDINVVWGTCKQTRWSTQQKRRTDEALCPACNVHFMSKGCGIWVA